MPAGHLLSSSRSFFEHSTRGNYHRLLNTFLCDCLPRKSSVLKPELAILLHVYYFLFNFIEIHQACDNLIKPFNLHSPGNFSSLFSTLAISLSSAHVIRTDAMSASRMIFHWMKPVSSEPTKNEPTKNARLFKCLCCVCTARF